MSTPLFFLDPESGLGLQDQVRLKIVEAVNAGTFASGRRLPSSRKLALDLGVSRNTVVLAYQSLIDEGVLVGRERSGLYVDQEVLIARAAPQTVAGRRRSAEPSTWAHRFKRRLAPDRRPLRTPNWRQYPYPFIDGLFDGSLFPVAEWRDAVRRSLSVQEIGQWSIDAGDADDPMLIEEIRTKVLPRRGIQARSDEILVTLGAQQALSLASDLLVDRQSVVALENPGYPDLRQALEATGARLVHQPVDDEGLVVDRRLDGCDLIYVTPSHQFPTAALMSARRRAALLRKAAANNAVIIEDDFACETNYLGDTLPALRSLDRDDRVIYVAGLAKVLGPGLRLGFMVAGAEVIAEARRLRRLSVRHPPLNNQRAAAFFLALGHYDATMLRLGRLFRERRTALRDALNHYLQQSVAIAPLMGGTTYWVRGPDGVDVADIAAAAEKRGVLIEPVEPYYADGAAPRNVFRLGVTSLPIERIRAGVALLADVIRDTPGGVKGFARTAADHLSESELRATMQGAVLLCKTVYGDPCTIALLPDGQMTGTAGYANEDCDTGHWWVEGDRWYRQWSRWSYGEIASFLTVIDGDRIGWFDSEGRLVDSALIQLAVDRVGPISPFQANY